jgi:chromosome segregation protein
MRLRSLEIHGFKSFYERITFSFPPGITTIVGPNGCGKSNILDAILWAIGERSAKHLRGKVMEDVIFSGTDGKKPLGMAEVSLILANDDGGCPEAYREFEEIMISRRLYRSGESEYFINKTPCRLRDVVDLFLDMGMSNQAYSIVEQGKIDTIINAKPEDRRVFIEEAAGIAKFRERRREALSKMEHTEQNLFRIQDVVGEIRRQIHSLERQVKKAEQYKRLRKEIRHTELILAYREYCRLATQQSENENTLGQLKKEEESLSTRVEEKENLAKTLRDRCAEWEQRISATERTIYETKGIIDREEGKIEARNRELAGLKNLDAQYGEEIDELNGKLQAAKNQRQGLQAEFQNLGQRIDQKEKELESKRVQWQTGQERWEEAAGHLEDLKADLVELLSQQSEGTNQIAFCERTLGELKTRKENNSREIKETNDHLAEVRSLIRTSESTLKSLSNREGQCDVEKKTLEGQIASQGEDLAQLESREKTTDRQYQMAWSTLQSLEELQKSFEGYSEGVKAVMLSRGPKPRSTQTPVADILDTEPRYEAAVSAVLAHRLQYLIVENHIDGLESLDFLKKQGRGRVGLIPMDMRRRTSDSHPNLEGRDGVIGHLPNHVRLKAGFEHLGPWLLGSTWLIEDLEHAFQIWQNGDSFHSLVTLGGEVLEASGVIIGGCRDDQASQILERGRKIKGLAVEVSKGRSELNRLREELEASRTKLGTMRSHFEAKEKEKQTLVLERVAAETGLERLTREAGDHEKRHKVLSFEQDQLKSQIVEVEKESRQAQNDLKNRESNLTGKREMIDNAKRVLQEIERQRESMDKEMTRVQVEIAEWREQHKGVQRSLDSLETQEKELRGQISKRLDMLGKNRKDAEKAEQDILDANALVKDWKKKEEEARGRLSLEKQAVTEKSKELREIEDASRRDQIRLEDLGKKIHQQNLQLAEAHLNLNHVVENIIERYRIDIRVSPIPEEIRTGEAPDKTQVSRLKASLDNLGEVNLVALQEYEDLKERYDFLVSQQDDLKASLNRLRTAIQRIDRTTRKRFLEAFEGTNEKFQALFPRLFTGGKATLVMTDEDDVLNTGIEILAQLPGKRLQRLDLLSGGEKALVALALIFSFFLYRPTPFFLMDEVDAPLDDSNVTKFLEILQELSDRSQLVVITHNKKTMEIAQTLYGITMESPGISKVVSVKLNVPRPTASPVNGEHAALAANA